MKFRGRGDGDKRLIQNPGWSSKGAGALSEQELYGPRGEDQVRTSVVIGCCLYLEINDHLEICVGHLFVLKPPSRNVRGHDNLRGAIEARLWHKAITGRASAGSDDQRMPPARRALGHRRNRDHIQPCETA